MKKSFIPLLVVATAVIGTIFALYNTPSENPSNEVNDSIVPLALGNPDVCTMSLTEAKEKAQFLPHEVKSLPITHSLQSAVGQPGEIIMYFAPGTICGSEGKYKSFEDGVIMYAEANSESSKVNMIAEGVEYFKEYKATAPIPEKVQLFEINGLSAMGWESGTRKNQFIDSDTKTILYEEDVPHPAELRIVDSANKMFYDVKGYVSLEELKKVMAETLR